MQVYPGREGRKAEEEVELLVTHTYYYLAQVEAGANNS